MSLSTKQSGCIKMQRSYSEGPLTQVHFIHDLCKGRLIRKGPGKYFHSFYFVNVSLLTIKFFLYA
uniref:Uncharacterized protein n=1 Tax=Anguilla anguilla TaxID=7936 RepID=A0A0E9X0A3_ANGAN